MDLYCVRDKRVTPNEAGSLKRVLTKKGRPMLKARCSVCGATKNRFLPASGN